MKVYFAGPLFTTAERDWNVRMAACLRGCGLEVFLPQESVAAGATARDVFLACVRDIDQCDVVLAVMDGPDPDSGTSWECGYAYAKGKPVLTVRTDLRKSMDIGMAPFNLMLSESAKENIVESLLAPEALAQKLVPALRGLPIR
jgi:nucleoside 2-deoxyribosyltransferase